MMAECLQDLVQCSICLERFTEPKMLSCQHTFCLNCLRGIIKADKTLDCPQCRETHQIPGGDLSVLKDNLIVRNLLDVVKESIPCFDCGRKLNLTECEHCQEEVCGDCRASHAKLLAQIEINMVGAKEATVNQDGLGSWNRVLVQIADEKLKLGEVFDDAAQKMEKKKIELSTFLDQLKNAIERFLDPSMLEILRQEIQNCKTNKDLDGMKNRLENVTKLRSQMLSDAFESDLKVTYDFPDLTAFGRVKFGELCLLEPKRSDVALSVEEAEVDLNMAVEKLSGKKSDSALVMGLNAIVPVCDVRCHARIDYKAKQYNGEIVNCGNEGPTFALFRPVFGSVLFIFAESVRVYTLQRRTWSVLSTKTCRHLALSDSGKLIIADSECVKIVNLTAADRGKNCENQLDKFRRIELHGIATTATQVGCFGNEFVVMDTGANRLKTFDEDGKFIREFGVGELRIGGSSKMCVDDEGRIYVTGQRISEKNCRNKEFVGVFELAVVLSWQGEFLKKIQILERVKNITQSILFPSTRGAFTIQGICVDSDGYISITRSDKSQIFVYNPKHQLHCTIGDPVKRPGEFNNPTGLSLMPDGRMIVSDTGNNRIQII